MWKYKSWLRTEMAWIFELQTEAAIQSDLGTKEGTSYEAQVEVDTLWRVDLYNDEVHTFDEVIFQLIKAISCSRGRAEDLAWTVHRDGIAHVFDGEFEDCLRVSGVLREIGLMTQIRG